MTGNEVDATSREQIHVSSAQLLIVEDNPNDLELTLRALRQENAIHDVAVVRDGAEALDFLFGAGEFKRQDTLQDLKVILLDLKLPKIDGLEVLRRIKSDDRTRAIPVVVLTSSKEDRDVHECYLLGANSYIVKPVDYDKFLFTVSRLGVYWMNLNQSVP